MVAGAGSLVQFLRFSVRSHTTFPPTAFPWRVIQGCSRTHAVQTSLVRIWSPLRVIMQCTCEDGEPALLNPL